MQLRSVILQLLEGTHREEINMTSNKRRYIFGAIALAFALCGLLVTFGSGAFAGDKGRKSNADGHGLMYQNLGF
jgi:hypothetical protein